MSPAIGLTELLSCCLRNQMRTMVPHGRHVGGEKIFGRDEIGVVTIQDNL